MNVPQRQVVASVVSGLCLVIVFLCPWRVESTGEVKWSPIYQQPLTYVRTYDRGMGDEGGYRIASEKAHISYGLLALEVLAVGMAGGTLYFFLGGREEDEDGLPSPGVSPASHGNDPLNEEADP